MMVKIFKYLLFSLLTISISASYAQLVHLGNDNHKERNGYKDVYYADGLISMAGKYYFTTPNGRFYETDGTEKGTRIAHAFFGHGLLLTSTNKYIYFAGGKYRERQLVRFDPATGKIKEDFQLQDPVGPFIMDPSSVRGTTELVDATFVSPEKDKIMFRTFRSDFMRLHTIHDDLPDKVMQVFNIPIANALFPDYLVWVFTELASIRNEVFFNGRVQAKTATTSESSIGSSQFSGAPKNQYFIKSEMRLYDKGYNVYPGFLRTKKALYALILDRAKSLHHLLEIGSEKSLLTGPIGEKKNAVYKAEVLNDEIYIHCEGKIFKFEEGLQTFRVVYTKPGATFDPITPKSTMLKAGNFLMVRQANDLIVINEATGSSETIRASDPPSYPLVFNASKTYAYSGKNVFYYHDGYARGARLVKYDPATKISHKIEFPELKNKSFQELVAILPKDDHVVLLTRYNNKKIEQFYEMFMFVE